MLTQKGLRDKQAANSALTIRFCVVLALASFIATLGLMIDSAVTVVGAMLIAPLMRPILALAYGLVLLDWRNILRGGLPTGIGVMITIFTAIMAEQLFELKGPTQEEISRIHPSLIDLGVAVAAGLAATMASNRPNIADSLPGVAIAVALVPPLCVVGLFYSTGVDDAAIGAFTLFAINLGAIILCAILVFLIDGYGKLTGALPGVLVTTLLLFWLSPGLVRSMEELSDRDQIQMVVVDYLRDEFRDNGTIHPKDLSRIMASVHSDHVSVFVEILAPAGSFDGDKMDVLFERISSLFDVPVNLKVQTLVTEEVTRYPYSAVDGEPMRYGTESLVPRK